MVFDKTIIYKTVHNRLLKEDNDFTMSDVVGEIITYDILLPTRLCASICKLGVWSHT